MTKRSISNEFAIVDLFAGPGGLAEGFSSFRSEKGERPFRIQLSIEMDKYAHQTLLLRSFLRQFDDEYPPEYYDFIAGNIKEPEWSEKYPTEWNKANSEALHLELGKPDTKDILHDALRKIKEEYADRIIVIGGPPCQAYSLVGRARNKGNQSYQAGKDHRYFLYKEYVSVISYLKPIAFVMENVKGLLSAKLNGERIFPTVLESLSNSCGAKSYKLSPINSPAEQYIRDGIHNERDFIVRSEKFGVPQSRHRIIVTGIRSNLAGNLGTAINQVIGQAGSPPTVRQLIDGMPPLRSGITPEKLDSDLKWKKSFADENRKVQSACKELPTELAKHIQSALKKHLSSVMAETHLKRSSNKKPKANKLLSAEVKNWIEDKNIKGISNHNTRGHMESDLGRYLFVAAFAEVVGRSPKASEFPMALAPDHKNWESGKFADRFRVQIWDRPATTVTSHISKDGHANIHPDPLQCRSLTVREAARLQTFPDNYHFKGERTQQFAQVGNAVPPLLAFKIAKSLWTILIDIGEVYSR